MHLAVWGYGEVESIAVVGEWKLEIKYWSFQNLLLKELSAVICTVVKILTHQETVIVDIRGGPTGALDGL